MTTPWKRNIIYAFKQRTYSSNLWKLVIMSILELSLSPSGRAYIKPTNSSKVCKGHEARIDHNSFCSHDNAYNRPEDSKRHTFFDQFRDIVLNSCRMHVRIANASMTVLKRMGIRCLDASDVSIKTPTQWPQLTKLNNDWFSNFIPTFTWTAFFPVAAAEPDVEAFAPGFASLFISV